MEQLISINKEYKLHEACAGPKDHRQPLENVLIEDGQMIATNGSIMAVVPCEPGITETIPGSTYKSLVKGKGTAEISIDSSTGQITDTTNGTIYPKPTYGPDSFPNWRNILPSPDNTDVFTLTLNAKLLYKLSQALGNESVTLHFTDNNVKDQDCKTAIHVTPNNDNSENGPFGLIMPMKRG